jgi:transcription termination/antitermination protein NusG
MEESNQPLEVSPLDLIAPTPAEDDRRPPTPPSEEPMNAAPEAIRPTHESESPSAETAEPAAEGGAESPSHPAAEPVVEPAAEETPAPAAQGSKSENMNWYILKVQSNREDSIREGLLRRVAIAGLDFYFGDVIVPMERVTEFKGGKKRIIKRKLYPGYLVVQMEINDDTWFLVRETPGIGDFTGAAGRPTPCTNTRSSGSWSRPKRRVKRPPN